MDTPGTVDITNVVDSLQKTFVNWGVAYVFGLELAIPGLAFLAIPGLAQLDQAVIRQVLELLSQSLIMQAFFTNTAIRKSNEAQDYISAVAAKTSLPPTATLKEIEDAEKLEMAAFSSFVRVDS